MESGNWEGGYTNRGENKIFEMLESRKNEKSVPMKRKTSTGKYKNQVVLDLKDGFKERLKQVAREDGKAYHALARELIIRGVKRLELRNRKEKHTEKQYTL